MNDTSEEVGFALGEATVGSTALSATAGVFLFGLGLCGIFLGGLLMSAALDMRKKRRVKHG